MDPGRSITRWLGAPNCGDRARRALFGRTVFHLIDVRADTDELGALPLCKMEWALAARRHGLESTFTRQLRRIREVWMREEIS